MEQFALCDVVMTQIKVSGGTTHSFATADEISCEPVIEEGETKNLTIKNKLIASKQVPDMVLGHDITCKDNVFTPALLADVQGGTVASSGSFTKYTAPNVGAMPNTKTFDLYNVFALQILVLHINLLSLYQLIMNQMTIIQILLMHIYSCNLMILICCIIINSL